MIDHETEQKIKDKLLQSLIDHMEDKLCERLKPHKAMSVEVAAPDKEHLVEGLSKAKELMKDGEVPIDEPSSDDEPSMDDDNRSDEDRLQDLADASDDEEDDRLPFYRGR